MSVICRTFVQNTWRSDLCSNCFKSLEDHSDSTSRRNNVCEKLAMPRYVPQAPSLYQSRGISTSLKWRLNESLYDRVSRRDIASQTPISTKGMSRQQQDAPEHHPSGILVKNTCSSEKKPRSRPSVDFAAEEALVIGYGGNDYDSDTSPWEMGSDDGSIDLDLLDDTDEDRKITRLTRNNTEFNSFNKNLMISGAKKEEEKLNKINNNANNSIKTTDKAISILTYNDIQSTKTEKKLNQYFFPSSTEIKSFLNSNNFIINENSLKNNNIKADNSKREEGKREKSNTKVVLDDNFSPLNTRTYSFVSELSKSNTSFEQSSDSDYSTYRHTAGDSTDSESFQDVEEARHSPKSSFLHSTYAISVSQINELDIDKKYDAGSSTSGDISNFSDDSDTHESTDRKPYKLRNSKSSSLSLVSEDKFSSKKEECENEINEKSKESSDFLLRQGKLDSVQLEEKIAVSLPKKSQQESTPENKQNQSKNDQNDKKSSQPANNSSSAVVCTADKTDKNLVEIKVTKDKSPEIQRQVTSKAKLCSNELENTSSKDSKKENEFVRIVSKSASMPDIKSPESGNTNKTIRELPKKVSVINHTNVADAKKSKEVSPKVSPKASPKVLDTTQIELNNIQQSLSKDVAEVSFAETDTNDQISTDKEIREPEDHSDYEKSPDAIVDRQSKLAALALELELARRDLEAKNNRLSISPSVPIPPPEVKVSYSLSNVQSSSTPASENYPTIKKASAISCASRLSTLPDVLQETPTKQKKTRFSLKKLLKRNKDSQSFSPANNSKEVNPKAWKKQTFDRNRLSLEIVHPMDLTSDVPTSADSTPTEEHRSIVSTNPGKFMFKGVSSRARSLSALPQLSGDDQSGCALLECRKMDTVPTRKAGTVAERKKNRPALVRTPSCSALPNRPASVTSSRLSTDRAPPPKPPPPPKCKAMHPPPPPPPPHSHPRLTKPATNSPARPPPPKVPEPKSTNHSSGSSTQELHEQNHSDKEYANLGDIRSLMTPKKPQRPSAFSAPPREGEMGAAKKCGNQEEIYETLPEEQEDHYTYLDEAEARTSKETESKIIETSPKSKPGADVSPCGRPWLDLQTSYAAIAATNYESLAELITTSLNEGTEYFKKMGNTLKWRDFTLNSNKQFQIVKEKAVYDAVFKNEAQDKVTLVVAPRKLASPQNAKNQTRYPVLASFSDQVPKNFVSSDNYILQESEMASIYILQQSKITTVSDFAKSSSMDVANQFIHLRNYCFVLLQLIHTLKSLQAEGIEEINYDLQILALVITDEDKPPILVLFPEDKTQLTQCDLSSRKTLCQATLETMLHFLQIFEIEDLTNCIVNGEQLAEPVAHTFKAIAKVLSEEKASSLSQAKGFLEYMLWGPVDVKISQNDSDDVLDTILQRWLDLQRAQMVKSTISNLQNRKNLNSGLHVYEEYQLIFLLQASVKSLKNVISKL